MARAASVPDWNGNVHPVSAEHITGMVRVMEPLAMEHMRAVIENARKMDKGTDEEKAAVENAFKGWDEAVKGDGGDIAALVRGFGALQAEISKASPTVDVEATLARATTAEASVAELTRKAADDAKAHEDAVALLRKEHDAAVALLRKDLDTQVAEVKRLGALPSGSGGNFVAPGRPEDTTVADPDKDTKDAEMVTRVRDLKRRLSGGDQSASLELFRLAGQGVDVDKVSAE
jgi:hypothetical protein